MLLLLDVRAPQRLRVFWECMHEESERFFIHIRRAFHGVAAYPSVNMEFFIARGTCVYFSRVLVVA